MVIGERDARADRGNGGQAGGAGRGVEGISTGTTGRAGNGEAGNSAGPEPRLTARLELERDTGYGEAAENNPGSQVVSAGT